MRAGPIQSPKQAKRGYTLLELVLVMALLVAAASMVIANISALPDAYRLSRICDDLRAGLAGIRARAMDEGVAMEFSFVEEGQDYRLSRSGSSTTSSRSSQSEVDLEGASQLSFEDDAIFADHKLPTGFKLKRTAAARSGNQSTQGFGGHTDRIGARFLPDGSSTGLEFLLDDGVGAFRIHIRAATGSVAIRRLTPDERNKQ